MFTWAVLAALVVTASAQILEEHCISKESGSNSTSALLWDNAIEDGVCHSRVDLSFVPGCQNQGVSIKVCDKDSDPLVTINDDQNYVDISRTGNCRGAISSTIQVYCADVDIRRSGAGGGAGKGASRGAGRGAGAAPPGRG